MDAAMVDEGAEPAHNEDAFFVRFREAGSWGVRVSGEGAWQRPCKHPIARQPALCPPVIIKKKCKQT